MACMLLLLLVKVCAILVPVAADAPLILALALTVHLKVVPLTVELKAILVAKLEQIVCVAGDAVTVGVGFTITL